MERINATTAAHASPADVSSVSGSYRPGPRRSNSGPRVDASNAASRQSLRRRRRARVRGFPGGRRFVRRFESGAFRLEGGASALELGVPRRAFRLDVVGGIARVAVGGRRVLRRGRQRRVAERPRAAARAETCESRASSSAKRAFSSFVDTGSGGGETGRSAKTAELAGPARTIGHGRPSVASSPFALAKILALGRHPRARAVRRAARMPGNSSATRRATSAFVVSRLRRSVGEYDGVAERRVVHGTRARPTAPGSSTPRRPGIASWRFLAALTEARARAPEARSPPRCAHRPSADRRRWRRSRARAEEQKLRARRAKSHRVLRLREGRILERGVVRERGRGPHRARRSRRRLRGHRCRVQTSRRRRGETWRVGSSDARAEEDRDDSSPRVGRSRTAGFSLALARHSDDTAERALGESSPRHDPQPVALFAAVASLRRRARTDGGGPGGDGDRPASRDADAERFVPPAAPMDARRASRIRPRAPPRRPRSSASRTTRWTRARRRRPTLGRRNPPWPTQRRLPRPKLSTPPRPRNQSRFPSRTSRIRSRPSSSVSSTAPFARS